MTPWVSFITTYGFKVRVTEITSRIGVSWTQDLPFCFWPTFNKWNGHIIKGRQPDSFTKADNSTNTRGLCSNFVECQSFLESNSSDILAPVEWLYWFWQFLCDGLSSFNLKGFCYSPSWSCCLREGRTSSFYTGIISRQICGFFLMF